MTHSRYHWLSLVLTSTALGLLLHMLRLPASVLLGCMLAGVWMGYRGIAIAPSQASFALAQSTLGCLIAKSLQISILTRLAGDWPFFLSITLSVIAASVALGWLLMHMRLLPGSTAVWGLAPGAASAMVVMSGDFGADVRLVALMQYLRVVVVTTLASLVTHIGTHRSGTVALDIPWLTLNDGTNLSWTLLVIIAGAWAARRFVIPGGAMLLPLFAGIALQAAGLVTLELPPLLLGLAYAVIGWSIGLRFNKPSLLYAWKVLPTVLSAIFALISVGVLHAVLLYKFAGFDPLTAYLATSPGGADSVAVIAATSAVDAGFVMAMQMARFVMVLCFGPLVSRLAARQEYPTKLG